MGFSGPIMAGVPLLANETGWGVQTIGWVLGGFGLGAAAAAGLLMWRKNVRQTGFVALSGLLAMALSVLGARFAASVGPTSLCGVRPPRTPRPLLGLGCRVLRHAGYVSCAAVAPVGQIGRVMSALSFSSLAAVPITYASPGLVTNVSNAQVPFLIGGTLMLVVAALAFANPQLRHLTVGATAHAKEPSNQSLPG
jgi:hypothetical protein